MYIVVEIAIEKVLVVLAVGFQRWKRSSDSNSKSLVNIDSAI
jgi:hypothetical protein